MGSWNGGTGTVARDGFGACSWCCSRWVWRKLLVLSVHPLPLFRWGFSLLQLGHGDAASVAIPKQILALQGTKVVDVQCGEGHSVVLTAEGQLLAFGRGRNGQLGRADRLESQAAARPSPRQVHVRGCNVVVFFFFCVQSVLLCCAPFVLVVTGSVLADDSVLRPAHCQILCMRCQPHTGCCGKVDCRD